MVILKILGRHDRYGQHFGIRDLRRRVAVMVQSLHQVVNDHVTGYHPQVVPPALRLSVMLLNTIILRQRPYERQLAIKVSCDEDAIEAARDAVVRRRRGADGSVAGGPLHRLLAAADSSTPEGRLTDFRELHPKSRATDSTRFSI
jgi:hypothetical protein